ncbi:Nn.00g112420.m01.CDS01 [Neocucurbitaria sp. VM-36]
MPATSRRKLEFRARRMACAYTKSGDDVWVTFVKRKHTLAPGKDAHMYLHTAPKLNHTATNLTVADVDFGTTSPQLGKYVDEYNFHHMALGIWSYYGDDLELKTRDELEGRCGEVERESSRSDASSNRQVETTVGLNSKEQFETSTTMNTNSATKDMTLDEYFSGRPVERHRVELSLETYGHLTADKVVNLADETSDEDKSDEDDNVSTSTKRVCTDDSDEEERARAPKKRSKIDIYATELEHSSDMIDMHGLTWYDDWAKELRRELKCRLEDD